MTQTPDNTSDFFEELPKGSLFQTFLNQVELNVFFKDASHNYVLCSASFARLLGYQTPNELYSHTLHDFTSQDEADQLINYENRVMETRTPLLNEELHLKLIGSKATVDSLWISISIYPLFDQNGAIRGTWGFARDISEEKNMAQKLVQKNRQYDELSSRMHMMATVDEVTGLYNRKSFEEIIRRNMRLFSRVRGRGYCAGFSIVLMDIDHFTKFIATYGTQTGDIALQYIAEILRSCSRSADDIFRVGNDEFALILPDTTLEGAQILASRITSTLARKPLIVNEEKEVFFTLCFGFAVYEDQLDASELIVAADQSLFDAKINRK